MVAPKSLSRRRMRPVEQWCRLPPANLRRRSGRVYTAGSPSPPPARTHTVYVTTSLSLGSIVVASRDQVSTALADEAVVLGMKDGVYYGLDPVGARIWQMVEQPITLREVVDALVREYEVDRERCAVDVLAFARDLADRGLLELQDDQPTR